MWFESGYEQMFDLDKELRSIEKALETLEMMVYFDHSIYSKKKCNKLYVNQTGETKQINTFMQELFRNMKLYDYIINFLDDNEELYMGV